MALQCNQARLIKQGDVKMLVYNHTKITWWSTKEIDGISDPEIKYQAQRELASLVADIMAELMKRLEMRVEHLLYWNVFTRKWTH
jgi:hypothetical protein